MKKIKSTIKRMLISYCVGKALNHSNKINLMRGSNDCLDFIYAIGSHAIYRDFWLKKVKQIQEL